MNYGTYNKRNETIEASQKASLHLRAVKCKLRALALIAFINQFSLALGHF